MKAFYKKRPAAALILRLFYKTEPVYLFWSFLKIAVGAATPLFAVYLPKLILAALEREQPFAQIFPLISGVGLWLLVSGGAARFLENKTALFAERFSKKLRFETGKSAMAGDLTAVESALGREEIQLAQNAPRLTEGMALLEKLCTDAFAAFGLSYIAFSQDFVFFTAVAAVTALKIAFSAHRYRYNKRRRILAAKNARVGDYLEGAIYFNPGCGKEVRTGNLQPWFLGKIKGYRSEMVRLQYEDFKRFALFQILEYAALAAQAAVVLFFLAKKAQNGEIGAADFVLYFTAVGALTGVLSSFSEIVQKYHEIALCFFDFTKFSAFQSLTRPVKKRGGAPHLPARETAFGEIVFHGVTFSYPGGDPVLKNINLSIQKGEKLVIVGKNGSGKSTLIKLLCKFYRPTKGNITLDGVDIWQIPNATYYGFLSGVFQDFANFAFTVAENVSMEENGDAAAVKGILHALNMGVYAENPGTYLTKIFSPGGVELSGGESQKLASARALYKNARVLILDEPTASLDPRAEAELYADFSSLSQGKTAIFISHRLSAVSVADKIAVLDGGQITEYGSHEKLMRENGLYAEMFKKQSFLYE